MKKIKDKIDSINMLLAINLSNMLASMYFFWFCLCIDIAELRLQPPTTPQEWCNFLSQTCIQLLALSILGFSSKLTQQQANEQTDRLETKLKEVRYEIKGHVEKLLEGILKEEEQEINILNRKEII